MPWVKQIEEGFMEVLVNKPVEIKRFHMDVKRNPSIDYKVRQGQAAMELFYDFEPDIIVTVDDEARTYFSNKLIGRKNLKLVYCGVNDTVSVNKNYEPDSKGFYLHRSGNETGVLERPDLFKVLQTIKEFVRNSQVKMQEARKRRFFDPVLEFYEEEEVVEEEEEFIPDLLDTISVLTDESHASLAFLRYLDYNSNRIGVELKHVVSTSDLFEWEKIVVKPDADALLIFSYGGLRDESYAKVDADEIISWTADISKVPTIAFEERAVQRGCLFAYVQQGQAQGRAAAHICLKLAKGERTLDIPIDVVEKGYMVANRFTAELLGVEIDSDFFIKNVNR